MAVKCIKCGCQAFWQEVSFQSDVKYEVVFDEMYETYMRKECFDRLEYDYVQGLPFKCKQCGTELRDEHGVALFAPSEIVAWARRLEEDGDRAMMKD